MFRGRSLVPQLSQLNLDRGGRSLTRHLDMRNAKV
jgi:hypothetical protein